MLDSCAKVFFLRQPLGNGKNPETVSQSVVGRSLSGVDDDLARIQFPAVVHLLSDFDKKKVDNLFRFHYAVVVICHDLAIVLRLGFVSCRWENLVPRSWRVGKWYHFEGI